MKYETDSIYVVRITYADHNNMIKIRFAVHSVYIMYINVKARVILCTAALQIATVNTVHGNQVLLHTYSIFKRGRLKYPISS